MKKIILAIAALCSVAAYAQKKSTPAKAPDNWFNLSYANDHVHGVGTERTYAELTKDKTPDTIIVAVIDGGVDYTHEDLKDVMWHNPGEIPGNGIDDDHNGYVDDVYGWNFIGGKDGKDVQYDNLELVRLYRPLYKKYKDMDENSVTPDKKDEYNQYLKLKAAYDKEYAQAQQSLNSVNGFKKAIEIVTSAIKKQLHVDTVTYANLQAYQIPKDATKSYQSLCSKLQKGITSDEAWKSLQDEISEGVTELQNRLDYNLNLDYDSRGIVGDNYDDPTEKYYGNNDVKGPDALHGTHVAGIIAANRFNNIGNFGVAAAVKIMAVRVVPNGDERDKDVANGIRYAVDNGAKVINMSFGKSYVFNKQLVDDAVKYAESKGVLLVHAAGNDNQDNDHSDNYPNPYYLSGGTATNWIEVGALSWQPGKHAVASFSNYGQTHVDVFAPGVDIHSCKSNGGYIDESGTSMASPVTAGVAAVLRCYYPALTPAQIRTVIMKSSDQSLAKKKVIMPGQSKKKIRFRMLSVSGGVVDLYAAFKLAATMK